MRKLNSNRKQQMEERKNVSKNKQCVKMKESSFVAVVVSVVATDEIIVAAAILLFRWATKIITNAFNSFEHFIFGFGMTAQHSTLEWHTRCYDCIGCACVLLFLHAQTWGFMYVFFLLSSFSSLQITGECVVYVQLSFVAVALHFVYCIFGRSTANRTMTQRKWESIERSRREAKRCRTQKLRHVHRRTGQWQDQFQLTVVVVVVDVT